MLCYTILYSQELTLAVGYNSEDTPFPDCKIMRRVTEV